MTYSEYKDNGIEWIEEVPAKWSILKARYLFGSRVKKNNANESLLSVTQNEGVIKRNDLDYRVWNPEGDTSTMKLVLPGDFVISLRSFQGGIELSNIRGIVSTAYVILKTKEDIVHVYYKYLFKSTRFISELNKATTGIRQGKNIPYDDFAEIYLTCPPREEQKQIANFLDYKTQQVDSLIEKTQQKIELLKEQRTALINQVVTKGLDSDVETKDSGFEWIGDISSAWKTMKLKHLGKIIIGLGFSPDDIVEEGNGTLVMRSSNVQNGKPSFLDNVYVNTEIPEKLRTKEGDILICSRNGSRKLIGKNCLITKDIEGMTFGIFMSIFRTPYWKYMYWILNSSIFKSQSGLYLTSTINQLTVNTLNNLVIPFTHDSKEQQEIVEYLDSKTQQIDSQVEKETKRIELLKEYRNALISEVVTGKIDVREEMVA
jgi:type I restriction enzyme, S subunit